MVSPKKHYHPIIWTHGDNRPVPEEGLASGKASGHIKLLHQSSPWIAITIPRPSLKRLNELLLENGSAALGVGSE